MKNDPKRNHYLAEFYLKGFCNSSGLLWLYDFQRGEYRRQKPRNIGVETNLYALYTRDGRKDVSTERMLSDVEGVTKPVIEKIERKSRLSLADRNIIATFVALMYARVPRFRDRLMKNFSDVLDDPDVPAKERADLARQIGEKGFRQAVFIERMLDTSLEFASQFSQMDWVIGLAPDEKSFITGDDPFTPIADENYSGSLGDFQMTTPGIVKVLPLTKKSCLFFLDRGTSTEYWELSAADVRKANCNTAFTSHRFIAGRDKGLLVSLAREARPVQKLMAAEPAT